MSPYSKQNHASAVIAGYSQGGMKGERSHLKLHFFSDKVEEEGHYIGRIKYRGETIGPPSITIICLSGACCNRQARSCPSRLLAHV